MKAPKLKPFKAWACVEDDGGVPVQSGACAIYCPTRPTEWHPSHYVRVVVRDARDDAEREAEIRRLRRAIRKALVDGDPECEMSYGTASRAVLVSALARKGRAK